MAKGRVNRTNVVVNILTRTNRIRTSRRDACTLRSQTLTPSVSPRRMSEHSVPRAVPSQINILALLEHSDRCVYRLSEPRPTLPATDLIAHGSRMRSSVSIQREVIKTFVSVNEVQLGTRAGMILKSPSTRQLMRYVPLGSKRITVRFV